MNSYFSLYLAFICMLVVSGTGPAVAQPQTDLATACKNVKYEGSELVPEKLKATADRLAESTCLMGSRSPIVVTSGVRSAEHQARLMQNCLSKQACGYYANTAAANEIQMAYDTAKKAEKMAAVAAKIREQVNREEPCFISKHLTAYALDLERHVNGTSGDCRTDLVGDDLILSQVLNASTDVDNITYKESSGCTHFHVNFIGWREIAGLRYCPKPKAEINQ